VVAGVGKNMNDIFYCVPMCRLKWTHSTRSLFN
jgi:hypothetical protein